ncbi:hypothetical protein C0995_000557 [Termitomyces sp. Mi166|nr:hypothetical protein C0995_000557 [Termitomyces sp. Mi166\
MAYCIANNINNALAKLIDINNWIAIIASINNNIHAQQRHFKNTLKTAKAEAVTTNASKKTTYKVLTTLTPLTSSSNVNSKPKNTDKSMLIATVMINAASDSSKDDGSDAEHANELAELKNDYIHTEDFLLFA